MKVRGDLNVIGTILQNGVPVDGNGTSGFYDLTVALTDESQSFTGIKKLNFATAGFYLKQNDPNTDEVGVFLRAGAGGSGPQGPQGPEGPQGSGFYLTVKQTDDLASFGGISVINVNTVDFYLTQNSPNTDEVTLNFRGTAGAGGGEANTASNKTGDQGIFFQKTGVDLEFKSLTAGANITLTPTDNQITIAAAGGGTITFAESEVGGFSQADDTVKFDSNPFYLTTGGDGNPLVSMKDSPIGLVETLTVGIDTVTIKNYTLDQSANYSYDIIEFVGQTTSGGAIGGFYINNVSIVGLDPVTFYPQEKTVIPTGALAVSPGDKVILSIFDNASALDLSFNLKTQRN